MVENASVRLCMLQKIVLAYTGDSSLSGLAKSGNFHAISRMLQSWCSVASHKLLMVKSGYRGLLMASVGLIAS